MLSVAASTKLIFFAHFFVSRQKVSEVWGKAPLLNI
jgi:hypothetical protein